MKKITSCLLGAVLLHVVGCGVDDPQSTTVGRTPAEGFQTNNLFQAYAVDDIVTFNSPITDEKVEVQPVINDIGEGRFLEFYDFAGQAILPFDAVPPHLNGGNPNSDKFNVPSGNVNRIKNIVDIEDILEYEPIPSVVGTYGADWFRYQIRTVNNSTSIGYVFLRWHEWDQDRYEPDDFIQFARDITSYIDPINWQDTSELRIHRESHTSDYRNPSTLDLRVTPPGVPIYPATYPAFEAGLNMGGDRDWVKFTVPTTGRWLLNVRTLMPNVPDNTEGQVGVSVIDDLTGEPLSAGPFITWDPNGRGYPLRHPVSIFWDHTAVGGYYSSRGPATQDRNHNDDTQNDQIINRSIWFSYPLTPLFNVIPGSTLYIRFNPILNDLTTGHTPIGEYTAEIWLEAIPPTADELYLGAPN